MAKAKRVKPAEMAPAAVEITAAEAPAEKLAVVLPEHGLNLRSGPGKTYNIVKVLPEGVLVATRAEAETAPGWVPVLYHQWSGWVMEEYIKILEG